MSATIGVAVATLLVAGGIVAGPSILECSSDSNGFGTCFRDKLAAAGLLAPEAAPTGPPGIVADAPGEPPPAPAPAGWMQAAANEYEAPAGAPVELSGPAAGIAAIAAAPEAAPPPMVVAVVPPMELAVAAPAPAAAAATVTLEGAEPGLAAGSSSSSGPAAPAEVALAGPPGKVAVMAPTPEADNDGAALLSGPEGALAGAAPEVAPDPVIVPLELQAEASAEPIEAPPPIAPEFDPQYPNVLVLPPPAEGDNSSFRSLQLN